MASAGHRGSGESTRRRGALGAPESRKSRRFFPSCDREEFLLEVRLAPATLTFADGSLAYAAANGETNQLAVDVVKVDSTNYVRFRELGGIVITLDGVGLVSDSEQQVRAPVTGVTSIDIQTGDQNDSVSLVLDPLLPGPVSLDTGIATTTDSVMVLGTQGDDAIGLAPRRVADGSKVIDLTENALNVTLKVVGTLTLDLSQDGTDSLSVDRSITGYGHEVSLRVIGGGIGTDSLSVTAPGSIPQTMTLSDGQISVRDTQRGPELFLGRSDNIAIDQPKVSIEVITQDSQGNDVSLGPSIFNTFLLDTGATSILSAAEATGDMISTAQENGTSYQTYRIPYLEQGVAGLETWDVSQPYRVDFAGNSGVRQTLDKVKILSSQDNSFSFFGPWGIMGMPAMVNRVTTMDMTGWHDLQDPLDLSMKVDFSYDLPAPTGHNYSAPLQLFDFPTDGQQDGGPIPTVAPLPFMHVKLQNNSNSIEGQFLVDTGAQLSLISTQTAIALGLDKNHNGTLEDEAVDQVDVSGVGGTVSIPLLAVDRASVPTDQGVDLVWSDLLVGVLDINVPNGPTVAGVFGSDYLTSGWAAKVLPPLFGEPGSDQDGYFQHVSFDFRNAANYKGSLIFDVTQSHDDLTPPSASALNITYTNVKFISAAGGSADDAFWVTPSTTNLYTIDGGDQITRDTLNLVGDGLNPVDDGSTVHIDGYQDISYSNIESKNFGSTPLPGVEVRPTIGLVTTEAGGTATFTVLLNTQPTADVTIPLSSSNPTEGTVSISSLTFTSTNWNIPKTVTVTGVDDFVDDGEIAYTIVTGPASSGDPNYDTINPADVVVTNLNDDTAGVSVSPTRGLLTTEAGGTATFSVVLTSQPLADVTIPLTSSNTAEGTVSPSSLVFTAANWNVPQAVLVTGVDDLVPDGSVPYTIITGAAVSKDPLYNGLNPSDVAVTNTDNDPANVIVIVSSALPNSTYGQLVSFTVMVSGSGPQPQGSVQFMVDGSNLGSPVTLEGGSATSPSTTHLGAGSHAIQAQYSGDTNNAATTGSYTQIVNQAALTLVADDQSMSRYDALPTLTNHYIGFVNGDDASTAGVTISVSLSTTATSSSPAGYYPIHPTVASFSAPNYTLGGTQDGTMTVKPKVVDVLVEWGGRTMSVVNLTRDLPFVNIKALEVIFSDDVAVDLGTMSLTGNITPGKEYTLDGFSYDQTSHKARWTLPTALDIDRLILALDGDGATADGHDGIRVLPDIYMGGFSLGFSVLPGDFNGDQVVNSQDLVGIRNQMLGTGDPALRIWADIDGNGVIDISDYNLAKKRIGNRLS